MIKWKQILENFSTILVNYSIKLQGEDEEKEKMEK